MAGDCAVAFVTGSFVYRSTRRSIYERADLAADKLALKVCGADPDQYDGESLPPKPKRMRWGDLPSARGPLFRAQG